MQKVIDYLIKKNVIVSFFESWWRKGYWCQMDGFECSYYNDDEPVFYKTLDEIITKYLSRCHAQVCDSIEWQNEENEAKYYFCEGEYIPRREEPDYDAYIKNGKERLIEQAKEYFEKLC